MISVRFFAKYREQLGISTFTVAVNEIDPGKSTVATLKAVLAAKGDVWREILYAENTLCAVNQDLAGDNDAVASGDEVAFYPPVTGG